MSTVIRFAVINVQFKELYSPTILVVGCLQWSRSLRSVQHCRKDNVLGSASEAKHLRTLVKTSTIQVDASGASIYLNGFGLAEGGEFERLMLKFTIMLNRIPNVETCTFAPLLANPC
jgi:hypothetical protein